MTGNARPTPQDISNARTRRQIADRQAEEYAEAERLAQAALGPGWFPWMKLSLVDSGYHRIGDTEPAAVAYKVYSGEQRLSANARYVRRMPDGQVISAPSYEPLFGEMLKEPHPTRTLQIGNYTAPCPRYSLCWSALKRYEPRSAEQLADARVKREQRAIDKAAEEFPLFADQIRSGEWSAHKPTRWPPG